ncbi:unnamed protein product [Rotaria sp. Silwood1]|nr:unnamed protein product [Rotaria sp. Silwood1]CAF1472755.1 unnamed protein product [Rotaria sp. Silwood1]CAF3594000.1 unnamed protein product [Rotaria sp. Silwood1]CAF3667254.1 unnamed protein product [Rotaria sp. Silwood1]CAF4623451.1 unnamed protein product [Rotaria sp. Silwood1]
MEKAIRGESVGDHCQECTGVWVDKYKNVYVTDSGRSHVKKWLFETNKSVVVAGQTDERGPESNRLNIPDGIYVDSRDESLYIADTMNHRIQKWTKGAQQGIRVAGAKEHTSGHDASTLSRPQAVWIDEETKVVYVVDTNNNRIQRWLPNASQGDTIVGRLGKIKA